MHLLEKLVDAILLVVRAERTPKDAVISAIEALSTSKLVGIVLNDVQYSIARYYRQEYSRASHDA
jgi:Mrp family chromosome partitioning ATPase